MKDFQWWKFLKGALKILAGLIGAFLGSVFLLIVYLVSPWGSEIDGEPYVNIKNGVVDYRIRHYSKPPEKMERDVERIMYEMKEKYPEVTKVIIHAESMDKRAEQQHIRATYLRERGEYVDFEKYGRGKEYQKQIPLKENWLESWWRRLWR